MANCSENKLNFTAEEMNRILKEAPLNASQRFSGYANRPKYFCLEEVLPLVLEKDRSLGKMITFLNHEEPHQIELWIFRGKSLTNWFDLKAWVSVPLPSMPGLARYLFSTTIRGIEVVEKAPAAMDNILYLQYEELPEKSIYHFNYLWSEAPEACKNVVLYLTLFTYLIGENGYDKVRVLFNVEEKPTGSEVTGTVVDMDGAVISFVDNGWWGPSYGFGIPADYEHTMTFTLNFSAAGEYKITTKLVNIEDGTLYAEDSEVVTVN